MDIHIHGNPDLLIPLPPRWRRAVRSSLELILVVFLYSRMYVLWFIFIFVCTISLLTAITL